MQNNEIKLTERSPESKELYYTKLALENVLQRAELRKLNDVILRKNYSIQRLLGKMERERARSAYLICNFPMAVGSELVDRFDSENPDSGKV